MQAIHLTFISIVGGCILWGGYLIERQWKGWRQERLHPLSEDGKAQQNDTGDIALARVQLEHGGAQFTEQQIIALVQLRRKVRAQFMRLKT